MLELRPIVVDADGVVLGGNMRLRALQEIGVKEVPIVRADSLTPEQCKRFVIADNVGFGEWDWDALANEWDSDDLQDWGLDIPGMDVTELEATEDDYEQPDEIQTDIVRGDLIEIGPHRLLCGDSTNADDVARLMGGETPELMITDPPYGLNYDANWRNEMDNANGKPNGGRAIGLVLNDNNADWSAAYALSPASVAYVWHQPGALQKTFAESIEKSGFQIRATIVWAKSHFAISRGHYHGQYEPCFYAVKKGTNAGWIGDRKQTTLWEIDKPRKSETGHSTQKPVECMSRAIKNHTGNIHDPFLGSGTTMVAAHQLNRICYGMELEPKYCQIVIDRMRNLDPEIVVKINGQTLTT